MARALSAALSSLPAAWGGAWLALIGLWAFAVFGPQVVARLTPTFAFQGAIAHSDRLVVLIILAIFKLMALGALYRIALFGRRARNEGLGLGGVQLAMPEARLFAAGIIVGLFWLLIAVTLAVVFAIIFNLSGLAEGAPSTTAAIHAAFRLGHGNIDWLFIGYAALSVLLLIFLAIKFSLFHAATVAERKMVTLNALGLSTGNVGKLFAGIVVLVLPLPVAGGLLFHHLHRHFVLSPRQPALDTPHLHLIAHAVMITLSVFVILPLVAGFLSSAYRQIVDLRAR